MRVWDLARGESIGSPLGGDADTSTGGHEYHDLDVSVSRHSSADLLQNVSSDERVFTDPADPQRFSVPGCIIAAPSFPGNPDSIPRNYFYNWTRDAAIVALELAAWPLTDNQPLIDYVHFAWICQNSGRDIGLAVFQIDGTPRPWSIQADGPALQTLAILQLFVLLDAQSQALARAVIKANMDFLETSYQESTTNLWKRCAVPRSLHSRSS